MSSHRSTAAVPDMRQRRFGSAARYVSQMRGPAEPPEAATRRPRSRYRARLALSERLILHANRDTSPRHRFSLLTALLLLAGLSFVAVPSSRTAPAESPEPTELEVLAGSPSLTGASRLTSQMPVHFEKNVGQAPKSAPFVARSRSYVASIDQRGATIQIVADDRQSGVGSDPPTAPDRVPTLEGGHREQVSVDFVGSNPDAVIRVGDALGSRSNYVRPDGTYLDGLLEADRHQSLRIQGVYDGIDVVWRDSAGSLAFDFDLAPHADPSRIRVAISGNGSSSLAENGSYQVSTEIGSIVVSPPRASQGSGTKPVQAHFVELGQDVIGIDVGAYDKGSALFIDPALYFSRHLGGYQSYFDALSPSPDRVTDVAVDALGYAYVVGVTESADFPRRDPLFDIEICECNNMTFLAKVSPDGTLVHSTYLPTGYGFGGPYVDVDSSGNAYILVHNGSTPTDVLTPTTTIGDFVSNIVLKVNASGQRVEYVNRTGSSCNFMIGGEYDLARYDIAVDSYGSAYFITFGCDGAPLKNELLSEGPTHLTKLNPAGDDLEYATYLDGMATSIDVDNAGAVYVTGWAAQDYEYGGMYSIMPTYRIQGDSVCCADAFVAKIAPLGAGIEYTTQIGGNSTEYGASISVDITGSAYVTGYTGSTNFPTVNGAFPENPTGAVRAFVAKLTPGGDALAYSTYLGGHGVESSMGRGIVVGRDGFVTVVGKTDSPDFDTRNSIQNELAGATDAFVARFDGYGTLDYSTYLGGSSQDRALAMAVDLAGNAWVVGETNSSDFPTTPGYEVPGPDTAWHEREANGFVVRIAPKGIPPGAPIELSATASGPSRVLLKWVDTSFDEGSFEIERRSGTDEFSKIGAVGADLTTFEDLTAQPNSTYQYRVRAANAFGGSGYSNVATVATPVASRSILTEGATDGGFETWVLLVNPDPGVAAQARLTFLTSGGPSAGPLVSVPPLSRMSLRIDDFITAFEVSTIVEGLDRRVVAERAVYLNSAGRQGAHLGKEVVEPASEWFMAEGAADGGFETWVLIANPDPIASTDVQVTYMTGSGPVEGPAFSMPPLTRRSVRVNDTVRTYEVSTRVKSSGADVVAERATYSSRGPYKGATASPAVPGASSEVFLAEGAADGGFDTWILVANPNPAEAADVQVTYMTSLGPASGPRFVLPPQTRRSVKANDSVRSFDVSTKVTTSSGSVVAERAIYSDHPTYGKTAATGEGVLAASSEWYLPEGSSMHGFDTWVLVANPNPETSANVQFTYLTEAGPVDGPDFVLPPQSRKSIKVNEAVSASGVGTRVVSSGASVVVDHSVFSPGDVSRDATSGSGIALP